ncbi:MAG: PepSY-associated TM helix domain-containing protein [Agriterribacter sp.]
MKRKKRFLLQWALHQQRWFGKWHVYLGIIAGAIVAFVGVTGSILVFQDEIDRALNPELFNVMAQQRKMPFEEIIPVIREKYPDLKMDYIMNVYDDDPNYAYRVFNLATEEETFINPYTGEISGKRIHESSFIHIVTELHRTLLIPVAGRYIVGLATLCLLILTISGLRLWIPQKWKQLKSVLTVNFKAGFKRQNYDWHNVLGFYSAPVVSLLSLTGFCITFSPLVIALLFILNGQSPQGVAELLGAKSAYTTGAKPLSLKQVVAVGKTAMPESKIAGLAFPADSTGSYRLDMITKGLPKDGKREMIIIDQYNGKILLNSRSDFPQAGHAYLSWLTPIHYGSFGGRPSQIIALIGGLMPLLLFITGFIIWWPRYKKQKRKRSKSNDLVDKNQPNNDLKTIPALPYFFQTVAKGLRYAGWVLLVSAVSGSLYGVFSGIVIRPAVFAIAFTTILVVLNFIVALLTFLLNGLFMAPFKKGSRAIVKYFALSLSFIIVFTIAYLLLMNTGLRLF